MQHHHDSSSNNSLPVYSNNKNKSTMSIWKQNRANARNAPRPTCHGTSNSVEPRTSLPINLTWPKMFPSLHILTFVCPHPRCNPVPSNAKWIARCPRICWSWIGARVPAGVCNKNPPQTRLTCNTHPITTKLLPTMKYCNVNHPPWHLRSKPIEYHILSTCGSMNCTRIDMPLCQQISKVALVIAAAVSRAHQTFKRLRVALPTNQVYYFVNIYTNCRFHLLWGFDACPWFELHTQL